MNLNYNKWREECLSSLVENDDLFVCVKCQGWEVKHPIYHYLRWHRLYDYIEPYAWLRFKRYIANKYITLYNHYYEKRSVYMLKYMFWASRRCEREKKVFTCKTKRTKEWEELLRLEREALVCMALEVEVL